MSPDVLSLIGVLLSLIIMVVAAWKGVSIMFVGVVAAFIAALFSGMDILDLLTNTYMTGFVGFAKNYWLMFMLSAIFGKLLSESGAARSIALCFARIARRFPGKEKVVAVWSMTLMAGVLCYGGVSLFVLVFTMVSISRDLYKELDIPWHLYMFQGLTSGGIVLCMLPGSPQVHNIIPTDYLGTTPMAAPVLGIIMAVLGFLLGHIYLCYVLKKCANKGEGFMPSGGEIAKADLGDVGENLPEHNPLVCLIPCVVLIIAMNVIGLPVVVSLAIADILTLAMFFRDLLPNLKRGIRDACASGFSAVGSTCAVVGFGSVVAAVPAFQLVLSALDKIPGPPVFQLIVAVNLAAGISGSGSGGLTIAMNALAQRFLDTGMNPQIIHRLASVSCCGLDSLPHNGANLNRIFVCRLSFKDAYIHIFVTNLIIPVICVIVGGILATLGVC